MSESIPGGYYCRSEELAPIPRAELFNINGSLSDMGLREMARIIRMLLMEHKLTVESIEGVLANWKCSQWELLNTPSELSTPEPIDYLRYREKN